MKRLTCLAVGISALSLAATAMGQQQIQVVVDGSPIEFEGQGPTMIQDRVLVPLRGVLEKMHARVDWDPGSQTVTARRPGTNVKLTIGQTTAAVNGAPVTLDVPAQILNGSTMVPLRFVGEALGEDVHWDASSSTVTITAGDYKIPPNQRRDHPWRQGGPPPPPPVVVNQYILPPNVVIPASLNIDLDSSNCRPGMTFETTVPHYPGLPDGCRVEGVVRDVVAAGAGGPGAIDFSFNAIITPNGRRIPIDGHPVRMDDPGLQRNRVGQFVARGNARGRFVVADDGGRPKFVNVHNTGPIHQPAAFREVQRGVHRGGRDVHVAAGTSFGIRLSAAVKIR